MRFEGKVLHLLKAKGVFKNMLGLGKAFVDIFAAEGQVVANICAAKPFRRAVGRAA